MEPWGEMTIVAIALVIEVTLTLKRLEGKRTSCDPHH